MAMTSSVQFLNSKELHLITQSVQNCSTIQIEAHFVKDVYMHNECGVGSAYPVGACHIIPSLKCYSFYLDFSFFLVDFSILP